MIVTLVLPVAVRAPVVSARSSGLLLSAASLTDNTGLTQQSASAAGNHVWQFTAVS
ncbi:hypothetical protein [Streptomyces sp. IBSBF 2435]|uniref:hypothetical protein n=1 Tax=Streptomyces sp. IBSBF 2435 TaxID=2903531 RepID=UPI002FDBA5A8